MASSGNFATWNGVEIPAYLSLSQGNTKVLGNTSTDASGMNLNTGVNSGKWYIEFYVIITTSSYPYIGLSAGASSQDFSANNTGYNGDIRYHAPNSTGMGNNTGTSGIINRWGTISTTETGVDACSSGDIVGFALDMDNKKLFISRNGTFFNSGDPANGTNPQASWTTNPESAFINCFTYTSSRGCIVNCGQDSTFSGAISAGGNADSNGFGDFKYTPPTGFLALCSANLPISDDIDPAQTDSDYPGKQFNPILYTGNGGTNAITGLGFKPDLVWLKRRDSSASHQLYDSSRGTGKLLSSNNTDAEQTVSTGLNSFDTDGFTLGSAGGANASSGTFVAWCWRANGGTTSSNSDGSITTTLQVGKGFSIGTYTGTGSNATVGHGLGAIPDFTIFRERGTTGNWIATSQKNMASNDHNLYLQLSNAESDGNYFQSGTAMTSSVISIGTHADINGSSNTYVMYNWINVEGYQKFGIYEGNGNSNGPFIYTGFRPRMLFIKRLDSAANWQVRDTARRTFNVHNVTLNWDSNTTETQNSNHNMDILSNGFKLRTTLGDYNTSGGDYIYGAWGDVPFKYNNTF